jgi:hypothetical protein
MIALAANKSIMIDLLVTNTIMRLNSKKHYSAISILWSKCRPPDQYYWTNSTSWTNTISTSWNMKNNSISWIRPHEKVNFDLMKFDLLTLSQKNYFKPMHITLNYVYFQWDWEIFFSFFRMFGSIYQCRAIASSNYSHKINC